MISNSTSRDEECFYDNNNNNDNATADDNVDYYVNPNTYPYYEHHQVSIYNKETRMCVYDDDNNNDDIVSSSSNNGGGDDEKKKNKKAMVSCVLAGQTPNVIPESFHQYHKSNASTMWEQTKRWRIEHQVYCVHSMKHEHFDAIKKAYFHVIHGLDKKGIVEGSNPMAIQKCK